MSYFGSMPVYTRSIIVAVLLALTIGLSFTALLLRKRDPKHGKAVLAVSYAVIGLWGAIFVGAFFSGIRTVAQGLPGAGFGIALICTLIVTVFLILAYRKKDRLVVITAAVLAVILACNTVVWGIAQFGDFDTPTWDDDMEPGWGEATGDCPDTGFGENTPPNTILATTTMFI